MHDIDIVIVGMSNVIKVALCARAALAKGVSRVLIVDWDVHHGQVVIVNRCNVFFLQRHMLTGRIS